MTARGTAHGCSCHHPCDFSTCSKLSKVVILIFKMKTAESNTLELAFPLSSMPVRPEHTLKAEFLKRAACEGPRSRGRSAGQRRSTGPRSAVRSWARKRHDRNTDDGSRRVSDRARPGRPAGDRPARRLTKLLIHLPGTHAAGWFPTSRKRDANRKDAEASGTAPRHARPCAQVVRKKASTPQEQNHRASRPRAAAGREAPRG